MIDPVTQLSFSIAENAGVYALLIGSGVSRAAEIPTGWEVILDLTRRVGMAEGVPEQVNWAEWYRERFGEEPNYSKLLDLLTLTASERRSILHHYIEPSPEDLEEGRRTPTSAHRAIARLVADGFIKVIVTTNFDRLLESALRDVGVEPTVISSVDDLLGASPLVHNRCTILKIHGDYLDSRILNTDDELATYPDEFNQLLDRIFDEYGLIVAGWSGEWDAALRSAILRAPNRRYPTFWASRGDPSMRAMDIVTRRAGKIISIADSDSFFGGVQHSVEVLHRTRRLHPDAIGIILASAKRYLAKPEHRIDLNDLVMAETAQVRKLLNEDGLPVQIGDVTWETVAQRWDVVEALAEPLARTIGLMGRWGDGSDFVLAESCLRALRDQPARSGHGVLLELRQYPAYLCYLTYALGLTNAGRFGDLFRWFRMDVGHRDRDQRDGANHLFMCYWEGAEADWWKHRRPEYSNRKTAWADHLVDHVVPWSSDYGLTASQGLENYNMTELLGGFAALTRYGAEELLALTQFTWMPHGRLMWANGDRAATLARLEREPLHGQILAGGFSNGSQAHWDGVKNNITYLARRVGW